MGQPLLSVQNLMCERDDRVLFEGLDFAVEAGQVLQVEGPNGSGKTTLLRILAGLNKDFSGDIFFRGTHIRESRYEFLSHSSILGHAPALKAHLTPRENLDWLLSLSHVVSRAEIDDGLDRVGLYGYEDTPTHQLSAGQQRRIALARLILSGSQLWILDEPFTAIDKGGVAELEQIISDHANAGGAVILTTHHALGLVDNLIKVELGTESQVAYD